MATTVDATIAAATMPIGGKTGGWNPLFVTSGISTVNSEGPALPPGSRKNIKNAAVSAQR